jgi:hypothetical protein
MCSIPSRNSKMYNSSIFSYSGIVDFCVSVVYILFFLTASLAVIPHTV